MEKNTNVIIRINSRLKEKAMEICKSYNISLSSLINAYLEDTSRKGKIPLNILSKINSYNEKENILQISYIKKCLDEVIKEYGKGDVKKAYLFGSYSRGEATVKSNINIRLEAGEELSLFDMSNMKNALEEKLGKDIALMNQDLDKLDPFSINEIRKDEICLYERR